MSNTFDSLYNSINARIVSGDLKGILSSENVTEFPLEYIVDKCTKDTIIPNIVQRYHIACEWEEKGLLSEKVVLTPETAADFQTQYLAYRLHLPIFRVSYNQFAVGSYASIVRTMAKIFDAVNGLPCILYFNGIYRILEDHGHTPNRSESWMEIIRFGHMLCQELDNLSAKVIPVIPYYDREIEVQYGFFLHAGGVGILDRHTSMMVMDIGSPLEKSVAKKMAAAFFHRTGIGTKGWFKNAWFKKWAKCLRYSYKNEFTEMDVIRLCLKEGIHHKEWDSLSAADSERVNDSNH